MSKARRKRLPKEDRFWRLVIAGLLLTAIVIGILTYQIAASSGRQW